MTDKTLKIDKNHFNECCKGNTKRLNDDKHSFEGGIYFKVFCVKCGKRYDENYILATITRPADEEVIHEYI